MTFQNDEGFDNLGRTTTPDVQWIDLLTQEVLFTVQAFHRLRVALGNKFIQRKS